MGGSACIGRRVGGWVGGSIEIWELVELGGEWFSWLGKEWG